MLYNILQLKQTWKAIKLYILHDKIKILLIATTKAIKVNYNF